MKTPILPMIVLMFGMIVTNTVFAQNTETTKTMKTYVIERDIPGAGSLTSEQLKEISIKSCGVLKEMGSGIEWVESYVTTDKIFCVYRAESEEAIRVHGDKGGFPVTAINEMSTTISPATATAKK